MIQERDAQFMQRALLLAGQAAACGEVPVGAVVVSEGQIVGEGYNLRESKACALWHAETVAIEQASRHLGAWRLANCELFVTLEPCLMCAGSIYQARIPRVVFAALDPKAGACGSLYKIHEDARLNHRFIVESGLFEAESRELLQDFFRRRRK